SNIQNNRLMGLKENTVLNSVKLYPNPANSVLNLELKGTNEEIKNLELSMTNMLGSIVYTGRMDGFTKTIDVSSLSKGVYTLYVNGSYGKTSFKVVVN
ncbi:MAG: T9SS type A sorting domain-containing protein, partial [Bacteroidia bacterium]